MFKQSLYNSQPCRYKMVTSSWIQNIFINLFLLRYRSTILFIMRISLSSYIDKRLWQIAFIYCSVIYNRILKREYNERSNHWDKCNRETVLEETPYKYQMLTIWSKRLLHAKIFKFRNNKFSRITQDDHPELHDLEIIRTKSWILKTLNEKKNLERQAPI